MSLTILKKFARTERGTVSLEAVLAFPMLIWILTAMFVFYDAFKTYNVSQKAAYSIGDMLSREEFKEIDCTYMSRMADLYDWLAHSEGDNRIVVSVIEREFNSVTLQEETRLYWSRHADCTIAHTDLSDIEDRLPGLALGEQLILVEGYQAWEPAFNVGLPGFTFYQTAVQRPRFAPKLEWDASSGVVTLGTNN